MLTSVSHLRDRTSSPDRSFIGTHQLKIITTEDKSLCVDQTSPVIQQDSILTLLPVILRHSPLVFQGQMRHDFKRHPYATCVSAL